MITGSVPRATEASSGCDDDAHEGNDVMSEVGEDIRYFDAINYEDVRLLVVRCPDSGGHDSSPQRNKRRSKPTTLFFTEVDDPISCPITHLVALTLSDNAFEAPTLIEARLRAQGLGPGLLLAAALEARNAQVANLSLR
ncbi:hypothetical protein ACEPPN_002339 [Leptodophora sp. 'Broadleaf-Isolate-01']